MDDPLYLALHKVRGEPALDIVTCIMIGEEKAWLVPTSGHRVYPFDWISIETVFPTTADEMLARASGADWDALPDHYEVRPLQKEPRPAFSARSLLEKIGLASPKQPLKRRSL